MGANRRPKRKWSHRSLLRACEEVLSRPDTRIVLATSRRPNLIALCKYHFVEGKTRRVTIWIDPYKAALIPGALHETLHVVVEENGPRCTTKLDEEVVYAFERALWVKMGRKEIARWRGLVRRKLGKP